MVIFSYAKNNLIEGEHLISEHEVHWIILFYPVFIMLSGMLMTLYLLDGQSIFALLKDIPINKLTSISAPVHVASMVVSNPAVVGFFVMLFGFLSLIVNAFYMVSTETVATNHRFIWKTGIVFRRTYELNAYSIEGPSLDQGIFGRILNYGNVKIRGLGVKDKVVSKIRSPVVLKDSLLKISIDSRGK